MNFTRIVPVPAVGNSAPGVRLKAMVTGTGQGAWELNSPGNKCEPAVLEISADLLVDRRLR